MLEQMQSKYFVFTYICSVSFMSVPHTVRRGIQLRNICALMASIGICASNTSLKVCSFLFFLLRQLILSYGILSEISLACRSPGRGPPCPSGSHLVNRQCLGGRCPYLSNPVSHVAPGIPWQLVGLSV